MGDNGDYWIQQSIPKSRRGRLRRFAKKHGDMTERGTIDLRKAKADAEKIKDPAERETRLREIREAETLRGLNRM